MTNENVELVRKYRENDELCKKTIGMDLKNFRLEKLGMNRETFSRRIDYSFCTITNVENGKYYPGIDLLTRISKQGDVPLYYLLNQECRLRPKYEDYLLFQGLKEDEIVRILMRLMCEKNDLLSLYDAGMIQELCVNKEYPNPDHVGYLIRLERIKRKVTVRNLSECMGITEKKVKDMEKGNASLPLKKLYFISLLLGVPIDFFLMECIESKRHVIHYLLSDVFGGLNEREREFYVRYIDVLKYKL